MPTKVAQIRQLQADEVVGARRRYHALLLKKSSLNADQLAELTDTAETLGKSLDDISADEKIIGEIREALPLTTGLPELHQNYARLKEKTRRLFNSGTFRSPKTIILRAIDDHARTLDAAADEIATARDAKIRARDTLQRHRQQSPDLFAALLANDKTQERFDVLIPSPASPTLTQAQAEHAAAEAELAQWQEDVLPKLIEQLDQIAVLLNNGDVKKDALQNAQQRQNALDIQLERQRNDNPQERAQRFAERWLRDYFRTSRGTMHPVATIQSAARDAGVDMGALNLAARTLGVTADNAGASWRI